MNYIPNSNDDKLTERKDSNKNLNIGLNKNDEKNKKKDKIEKIQKLKIFLLIHYIFIIMFLLKNVVKMMKIFFLKKLWIFSKIKWILLLFLKNL